MISNILHSIYDSDKQPNGSEGDCFKEVNLNCPPNDFVLCRRADGIPTAIYGEDNWDFNPYRSSATSIPVIRFSKAIKGINPEHTRSLIDEVRWLLFCCIYKSGRGRLGRLGAKTIYNSTFLALRDIANFTALIGKNRFNSSELSVKDIISNEHFLKALYSVHTSSSRKKRLNSCLDRLVSMGVEKTGYPALKLDVKDDRTNNQHPIIPPKIYLGFITELSKELEMLESKIDDVEAFIICFKEKGFGMTNLTQKNLCIGVKDRKDTMTSALEKFGLTTFFADVKTKHALGKAIRQLQYSLKNIIHLYTGMRDEEVLRMPFFCLHEVTAKEVESDDKGKVLLDATIIKVLSTTTKFEGYRKEEAWFAHEEVARAVVILQKIARAIAKVNGFNPKNCPLFLNAGGLFLDQKEPCVTDFCRSRFDTPSWLASATITNSDYELLKASDPSRDFNTESKFAIGEIWPLTSHQFRRSLAFYASNSGFISLPTLRRQFKHLSNEMSKYYARNFENIRSIFGYYCEKTGEWVLPKDHVLFDCQAAVPSAIADQIIDDLLGSEEMLLGKSGGYIDRQRQRIGDGIIDVEEFRTVTEKRVADGELAYRKTLLGGCTNIEVCDCRMLGEFTDCLGAQCAVIKGSKVEKQIHQIENAMGSYSQDTGEYQVLKAEYDSLIKFKTYRMSNIGQTEQSKEKISE